MLRLALPCLFVVACIAQGDTPPAAADAFGGDPRLVDPGRGGPLRVLVNPGFRIGYSDRNRQPAWVSFKARDVKGRPRIGERPRHFSPDLRLDNPVTGWDYVPNKGDAIYTRGHLAPNYLIGKLHGREGQLATFLMSNVSPQTRRLNSLAWQRLEEAEVDIVAPAFEELWVLTGPVFGGSPKELKRGTGIPVPEAFYRIWLDVLPSGEPRVLAFIVPQDVCGTEALSQFLVTVDDIEARTGLDFYSDLDDVVERRLEQSRDTGGWQFKRIERRQSRYAKHFEGQACAVTEGM